MNIVNVANLQECLVCREFYDDVARAEYTVARSLKPETIGNREQLYGGFIICAKCHYTTSFEQKGVAFLNLTLKNGYELPQNSRVIRISVYPDDFKHDEEFYKEGFLEKH